MISMGKKISRKYFYIVLILLIVCLFWIFSSFFSGILSFISELLAFDIFPRENNNSVNTQQNTELLACGDGHLEIGEECELDRECKGYEECVDCKCVEKGLEITEGECADSDGRNEIEVGLCVDSNGRFEDYCSDWNVVYEYQCSYDNTYCRAEEIRCSGDCIKGICTTTSDPSCSDTDGGKDAEYLGMCVDQGATVSDACVSETQLVEWFCGTKGCERTFMNCPSGTKCSNGLCS